MFGNKKNNSGLTFVAQGTKLSGESHFSGEALIGGELYGKISSAGKITIEVDGYVDGELNCEELKVSGNFKGKLKCNKLNITSTGTVEGEIACESMEIFEGGQFIGMRVREDIALLKTVSLNKDCHVEPKPDIQGELQAN
ncbi:polymer-forming cytoskeletal protein [Shewanella eurypsychrophilus]|uniref:Polymer-forming cytoskeletal protein n=1 Tax=Shewanella eurypsychrophilus TaxID=2593656 RepID=A0ABX6V8D9_9GAMM|nr:MULTISPECIES: polymer-forming cytoskeletal protein [Shewanella]QFU23393.1 polymer-forming cytoskeletal protein [Shewanella sp. YLB-09]QPG58622.1 polymer-forming cytoskeletal protein [Shewanella eurypsychrophilus]